MPRFDHPSKMGLQPLESADWFAPIPDRAAVLVERRAILDRLPAEVLACLPESDAAVEELCRTLSDLGRHAFASTTLHARLDECGRHLVEDICVLTRDGGGVYRLTAGVLCFPNRWRLVEKLGGTVLDVHAPVPGYRDVLARPVDQFLDRLRPMRGFIRKNWGVTDRPDLHLPDPGAAVRIGEGSPAFLREEFQSFMKLPQSDAVIFSIRTVLCPVSDLAATEQAALQAAVGALAPDWHRYKSLLP